MSPAVRALVWFWAGLLALVAATAGLLQFRGPLRPAGVSLPVATSALPRSASVQPAAALPQRRRPSVDPIVAPDAALEEPAPDFVGSVLPRIGADGRTPLRAYAAAAGVPDRRPRLAILVTGLGLSAAEDEAAVDSLPAAVSFAISPYSYRPDALLQKLRQHGHESFVSLPMEPQGYPTDDPGPEALLTGNTEGANQQRLEWALSRIAGYVGVTSAMGALHGERFAGSATQMAPVLRELSVRGVMYVDARVGVASPAGTMARGADAVIDATELGSDTERALAGLEAAAHDHGTALGVAGPPHPVTVARLASWAATLAARGFVLVPVSALAPAGPP